MKPFNESLFTLRLHYATVFPEFAGQDEEKDFNESHNHCGDDPDQDREGRDRDGEACDGDDDVKLYKITYTLNLLPSIRPLEHHHHHEDAHSQAPGKKGASHDSASKTLTQLCEEVGGTKVGL